MKRSFSPLFNCSWIWVAVAITVAPVSSHAFLKGLFNGNKKVNSQELASQQGAAATLLQKAQGQEQAGKTKSARDTYRSVYKNYPRTEEAGEALFRSAQIRERSGDPKDAFDEYQVVMTEYRNSPHFTESLQRQYAIAEALRNSDKKGFLGMGAAVQPSKLIEMFQQIAKNAPFSEYAPKSQLNVGRIHARQGSTLEAIVAYQKVVESYPNTKQASEAQYEIFELRGQKAEKSNSPVEDRAQVEAGLDFMTQNPDDARAQEVKAGLDAIEERSMEKFYNTGTFYEKSGKPEAAKVYYREVVKQPNSKWAGKAQSRLNAIDSAQAAGVAVEAPAPEPVKEAGKKAGNLFKFGRKKAEEAVDSVTDAVTPVPEATN